MSDLNLKFNSADVTEEDNYTAVPSYLVAADTHNYANGNESFLDSLPSKVSNFGKYVGLGLASGINQLYNIAPSIGNAFGGDFKENDLKVTIQDFDSDLGKYYEENQKGIDTLGFVLSSIVPGSGGIKLANAGTKLLRVAAADGVLGENLGKAFSLLPSSREKYLQEAIKSAVNPNAGFPIYNPNTFKAIASGAGAAAFEGAAFETAVQATMFNSPTLKDQDIGDITSNILHGAATFGVLGGVISGASTIYKIKKAGRVIDEAANEFGSRVSVGDSLSGSSKILTYLEDAQHTPQPTVDKILTVNGAEVPVSTKFNTLREDKLRAIDNDVRLELGKLSKGDETIATLRNNEIKATDFAQNEAKLFGTAEISRVGTRTEIEKELSKLTKKAELGQATPEELASLNKYSPTFTKISGEGAGVITGDVPKVLNLVDTLPVGQALAKSNVFKDALKSTASFDPFIIKDHLKAEALYINALDSAPLKSGVTINEVNIPLLEKAYAESTPELKIAMADGTVVQGLSKEQMFSLLQGKKESAALELMKQGELSIEEIAKIVNVKPSYLSGETVGAIDDNLFAMQSYAKEYTERMRTKGVLKEGDTLVKTWQLPSYIKEYKDTTPISDINGNSLDGMVAIKQQQKAYEATAKGVAANILGEDAAKLIDIPDKVLFKANRTGPGNGLLSTQSENYGTTASFTQYVGAQVNKIKIERLNNLNDTFNPVGYQMLNKQEAAIEFAVLNAKLRSIPEEYALAADGSAKLVPLKLQQYQEAIAAGQKATAPTFASDIPLEIPFNYKETFDAARFHVEANSGYTEGLSSIRSNQGLSFKRSTGTFYPIPPKPSDFPHYAFVVDDSVKGTYGRQSMLHAATKEKLEELITATKQANSSLSILTGKDAENYYKSIGKYEYERTLTDLSFDSSLQRTGASSQYIVPTDPNKIVGDLLQWHKDRTTNLITETVLHRYEPQVKYFNSLAEQYTGVNTSHYKNVNFIQRLESNANNPYDDYTRALANLSDNKNYPFWSPLNELLDRKISGVIGSLKDSLRAAKSPDDLVAINNQLQNAGFSGPLYTEDLVNLANHSAPRGVLTNFVQKANALLGRFQLAYDPVNAITNVLGANVLRSTETSAVIRRIGEGSEDAVGALAKLDLKVPGTNNAVYTPYRLQAEAIADYFGPGSKELMERYKSYGFVSDLSLQQKQILETLRISPSDTEAILDTKISKAFAATKALDQGLEKYSGNKLAEEFNRFISARVMDRLTESAVTQGKMTSQEALAYINTFVSRVEGNFIAAQRPGLFRGPIGQAVGLFQTYQFNLLQNLFRHIGEGTAKDSLTLLGMQGTIFGMQGLPAFNAINTHIIGLASGNRAHTDAYDAVYGAAGKEAGDWLMYGAGSNALGLLTPELKINLYSRGDINPRNVSIIPVNPADIPFVSASAKLYKSIKDTTTQIAGGGDVWNSFLQGVEHSGLSRPLAGLAATLQASDNPYHQAYTTSSRGNVVAANDLLSLTTAIRLAGAKPLDEAKALDRVFNIDTYSKADADKRSQLGETIKTAVIAGKQPSQEQVNKFAYDYVKYGGKQTEFNKFMVDQFKNANTSQANSLKNNLGSVYSQSMQRIMGAYELRDFKNISKVKELAQPDVDSTQ